MGKRKTKKETFKVPPIRLVIAGKPKLYKPCGARFIIRLTSDIDLVFIPRFFIKKNESVGISTMNPAKVVEYVFNGVEKHS